MCDKVDGNESPNCNVSGLKMSKLQAQTFLSALPPLSKYRWPRPRMASIKTLFYGDKAVPTPRRWFS